MPGSGAATCCTICRARAGKNFALAENLFTGAKDFYRSSMSTVQRAAGSTAFGNGTAGGFGGMFFECLEAGEGRTNSGGIRAPGFVQQFGHADGAAGQKVEGSTVAAT